MRECIVSYAAFRGGPRIRQIGGALALALLTGACALPPTSSHLQPLASAGRFPAAQTLAPAAQGEWPSDGWWQAYGDKQLDALIAEGLQGATDCALPQRGRMPPCGDQAGAPICCRNSRSTRRAG
jgi:hypothetical protein